MLPKLPSQGFERHSKSLVGVFPVGFPLVGVEAGTEGCGGSRQQAPVCFIRFPTRFLHAPSIKPLPIARPAAKRSR